MNKNKLKSYQAPKLFELQASATNVQGAPPNATKPGNATEGSNGAPASKRPS